ncbi:Phage protein [Streptococcus oralis]|uniref:Phage protein n=1 Tax=Streptococcus oralis TaxID=1303 RepID=A0A139RIK3_STROR|nr:hypothetical protein [Streptococcus oralis]KXU14599.1 Phage protein [Streptococcus oralis]
MSSGATLKGFDDVLRNMEAKLGDAKVRRVANRALKGAAEEMLEDFKGALEVFKDTGETIESATVGRVTGAMDGVPTVKLGFGAGSRWRLVHLNELGYAKNRSPRGFGVIRRFSEANAQKFKYRVASRLKVKGFK